MHRPAASSWCRMYAAGKRAVTAECHDGPTDGDAARPARRRGGEIRRSAGARDPARGRHGRPLDLPRARAPLEVAAFRLRALGLQPGRPPPDLVALDAGAPRDLLRRDARRDRLRPAGPADVEGRDRGHRPIVRREAPHRRAPAATRRTRRSSGSASFPTTSVDVHRRPAGRRRRRSPPTGRPRSTRWPRPKPDDLVQLIFTSGTTGTPKGVMLAHDNLLASNRTFHRIMPPMEHRIVSLLPLSHLLEQAVGRVLRALGRRERPVRAEPQPAGDLRCAARAPRDLDGRRAAGPRPVLERHRARGREVRAREASSASFGRSPAASRCPLRRLVFRRVHAQLGGSFRLFVSAGAFLPPALQQAWEDMGVTVLQGYGATETGTGSCTTLDDHGLGTVGRAPDGIEMRLRRDGEVQFRGPTLFKGYWQAPEKTRRRVHRRRLVHDRRRRPLRRRGPARPLRAGSGT